MKKLAKHVSVAWFLCITVMHMLTGLEVEIHEFSSCLFFSCNIESQTDIPQIAIYIPLQMAGKGSLRDPQ